MMSESKDMAVFYSNLVYVGQHTQARSLISWINFYTNLTKLKKLIIF